MNEQRAYDAVRHLQAAAVEMIEAARAALEVVEEVIRDPSVLADLMAAAQAAGSSSAGAARGRREPGPDETDRAQSGPGSSRVTRIPVS